jgi:hypothetical protein
MENLKELLDKSRRKMLIGFAAGFGIWRGSYILKHLIPPLPVFHAVFAYLLIISFIGWAMWFYYLIKIIKLSRIIKKNPALNNTLNNEYIQHIRLKAFSVSFVLMLLIQPVLLFTSFFISITVPIIIDINISIAVLSVIIAYLIFDRE